MNNEARSLGAAVRWLIGTTALKRIEQVEERSYPAQRKLSVKQARNSGATFDRVDTGARLRFRHLQEVRITLLWYLNLETIYSNIDPTNF